MSTKLVHFDNQISDGIVSVKTHPAVTSDSIQAASQKQKIKKKPVDELRTSSLWKDG